MSGDPGISSWIAPVPLRLPVRSTREGDQEKLDQQLAPFFRPPARYANDVGNLRSPLKFLDGSPVRDSAGWVRRRREILRTWHEAMGPWPKLLEKPTIEYLEEAARRPHATPCSDRGRPRPRDR